MIETIKVSSRGQIVIPERIRRDLKIEEGTKNVLIEKDNSMELEKLSWLALAENNLKKLWNNKKEDEVWARYL